MKVCFFAPVKDKSVLTYNQFYAQDIAILRELSDELVISTSLSELTSGVDLYFIWWWSWAFLPLIVAAVAGSPSIITGTFDLENPIPGSGFFTRPWHHRTLMRAALRSATFNVFVSRMEYERVPKALPTRGARFVPHVVDGDLHPYRGREGRLPFLFTICWMHGQNPLRKGVDLAIRAHAAALKKRPTLELRIAGSPGDAQAGLERLVASLGTTDHVRFLGRIDHDEKVRLLQTCEAYLQPSIYEGFGVAAAEAMCCGAPVIAFPVGALSEVLGEDAVWAAPRTPEGLVAALDRLRCEFTEERRARAAERIRTTYSYDRRRRGLAEAIDDAVGSRHTTR